MDSYQELLGWAYDLQKFGIKLGLSSTRNLLERLGNPHERVRVVHVGGTNGKGSVSAMISSMLSRAGYRVGFYSSPHLVDFEERFRIGETPVSRSRVTGLMRAVKSVVDHREPPTFFEFTTAMAFLYFHQERTDVALMEVGLGGRLDATNVSHPLVTVITNISLEHQEYLGHTIEEIAAEKAGIIKPGVPVISGAERPDAIRVIEETCRQAHAPFYLLHRDFRVVQEENGFAFHGFGRSYREIRVGLKGSIQAQNAALALAACRLLEPHGFSVPGDALRQGLLQVHWPGRFQQIGSDPPVILDGAHNPAAMNTLRRTLLETFPGRAIVLVLGIMNDKAIPAMVRTIAPLAHEVICTRPAYSRAAPPETIEKSVREIHRRVCSIPTLAAAIRKAHQRAQDTNGVAVICGSLFTVGETLALLRENRLGDLGSR